jgi:putative membrane protein
VALGGMLMRKVANGTMVYYIKADLIWIVLLAALALVLMGGAYLIRWAVVRPAAPGWRANLVEVSLLVPLLAGLLLPARPLASFALEQRGLNTYAAPAADERLLALQSDTTTWTLLDWWLAVRREADPSRLGGKPVAVTGFVGGGQGLGPDEFNVARFVVTCCAADGAAVGLTVRATTPPPAPDTWVRVEGVLEVDARAGQAPRAVVVAASVAVIESPANPYLYP